MCALARAHAIGIMCFLYFSAVIGPNLLLLVSEIGFCKARIRLVQFLLPFEHHMRRYKRARARVNFYTSCISSFVFLGSRNSDLTVFWPLVHPGTSCGARTRTFYVISALYIPLHQFHCFWYMKKARNQTLRFRDQAIDVYKC